MKVMIAVTGASGSVYAERLVEALLTKVNRIYLVASQSGKQVVAHELRKKEVGFSLRAALQGELDPKHRDCIRVFDESDLFAPVASGSSVPSHMVVVPSSMGTLARIHHGLSSNLIERAADVMLKQGKPLIICPRETPLNTIHLENMLGLSKLGVKIVPAMPAFYQHPTTIDDLIDFVVGRILELLNLEHDLYRKWNPRMV